MLRTRDFHQTLGAGTTAVIGTIEVPQNSKMKLLGIEPYVAPETALGLAIWRIRRNGIPVFPYNELVNKIHNNTMAAPIEPLEFMGGDTFEIFCENASAAPAQMGMVINFDDDD
jgi:hypothetical protein